MNDRPKPTSALSEQEQLLAKARATAYGLAARLILSPSDPGVHQQMAEYLDGEGAQAMAAMRDLEQLTSEQVEQRLRELSMPQPQDPAPPSPRARNTNPTLAAQEQDEPTVQETDWQIDADSLDGYVLEDESDETATEPDIEPATEDRQDAEPQQDQAVATDDVDPDDDDDEWLREWDREALAAGESR